MEVQPIKDAHHQKPFKPFTITTAAGDSYRVTHPEAMWQTEGGKTILLRHGAEGVIMLDAGLITAVDFVQPKKRSSKDS